MCLRESARETVGERIGERNYRESERDKQRKRENILSSVFLGHLSSNVFTREIEALGFDMAHVENMKLFSLEFSGKASHGVKGIKSDQTHLEKKKTKHRKTGGRDIE